MKFLANSGHHSRPSLFNVLSYPLPVFFLLNRSHHFFLIGLHRHLLLSANHHHPCPPLINQQPSRDFQLKLGVTTVPCVTVFALWISHHCISSGLYLVGQTSSQVLFFLLQAVGFRMVTFPLPFPALINCCYGDHSSRSRY